LAVHVNLIWRTKSEYDTLDFVPLRFRVTLFDLKQTTCTHGAVRWGSPTEVAIEKLRNLLAEDFTGEYSEAINVDLVITTRKPTQFSEIAELLTASPETEIDEVKEKACAAPLQPAYHS
jgi:hypothetical protein